MVLVAGYNLGRSERCNDKALIQSLPHLIRVSYVPIEVGRTVCPVAASEAARTFVLCTTEGDHEIPNSQPQYV